MSAIGTTLLQNPGWNEGKARNATLGKHRPKRIELRRSGTYNTNIGSLALIGCAAPWGLNKCVSLINPGLAPWAMQEYRPYRAPLRLPYYFVILKYLPWRCSMIALDGAKNVIFAWKLELSLVVLTKI